MSGKDAAATMAAALMEMTAMLEPLGEAVDGYRADLEKRGYSPTMAEAMAFEFYRYLMAQLTSAIGKPS